jgi:thiaminase/transcriptional activator TenA
MQWSEKAWKSAEPVYARILELPFLHELMIGTLAKEKFLFYINQDAIYLAEYGKILAGIASKLPKKEHMEAFLLFSGDTIMIERTLHESYLKDIEKPAVAVASPSCLLYTCYMNRQLFAGPIEVALATVLPCFWVYQMTGNFIFENQSCSENPYQSWINTYCSEEFAEVVSKAIAICDEVAATCTEVQQQDMTEAFILATKMEWMFWNSAWNLEQWDV